MSFYLVDYENAKNLSGISKLSPDDHVIIFYSEKACTLTFETHLEILSSNAQIEYKRVKVGKNNALDFQLDSYLGYVISQNERSDCKYYIVAKDGGYSYIVTFWKKEKSLDIQIISDLTGNPQNTTDKGSKTVKEEQSTTKESKKAVKKKPQNSAKKAKTAKATQQNTKDSTAPSVDIDRLLRESHLSLPENELIEVINVVTKYKTTQTINSNLNKLLKDSSKTGEILKIVKPYIKKAKAVKPTA